MIKQGWRRACARVMVMSLVAASLGFATVAARPALAAPQPSPVPTRWELRIEPGPLRVASIDVDGEGAKPYFYFTFKVTNLSGEDRFFAPSFELATDDGEVVRSGRDVPRKVYERLLERLDNPFLEDELKVQGTLAHGKENAREGLVVWPAENLKVDTIKLFASGFSGETKRYRRPDTGEEVVLRKQYMLEHLAPGTIDPTSTLPIPRQGRPRWIMR